MSMSLLKCVQSTLVPIRSLATHFRGLKFTRVPRTYYNVLRVPLNSSGKEIRSAFIELSKKYHPDGKGGKHDPEEFVRICEAYKILYKRASIQHPAHGQRKRYRPFPPMESNFSDNSVLNRWNNFHAAVRFKQFSYDKSKTIKPAVNKRQPKPKAMHSESLPAETICCRSLVCTPRFSNESYANWMHNCLLTGFCLILALLLIEVVKSVERTPQEIERQAPTNCD